MTTKAGAIRTELMKCANITPNRGEDEISFLTRLHFVIAGEITEAQWAALSTGAQDWNNAAADALDTSQPLPKFPDETEEQAAAAPAAGGRRRGAAAAAPAAAPVAFVPTLGAKVVVTTARGAVKKGIVVEMSEGLIVVNKEGENGAKEDDEEFMIEKVTVQADAPAAAAAPEAAAPAEPEIDRNPPDVGDTVQVITARDKTVLGNVLEVNLDNDLLVIKDPAGSEHELSISRLKDCVVKLRATKVAAKTPAAAPAAAAAATAPAAGGRRRGAAAPAAGDGDEEGGKLGVGSMIRTMLVENENVTLEQCEAALTKASIDFRPVTAKVVFKSTKQIVDAMLKKFSK